MLRTASPPQQRLTRPTVSVEPRAEKLWYRSPPPSWASLSPCVCLCCASPRHDLPRSSSRICPSILLSNTIFSESALPATSGQKSHLLPLITWPTFSAFLGLRAFGWQETVRCPWRICQLEQVHGGPVHPCLLMRHLAQCGTQASVLSHTSLLPCLWQTPLIDLSCQALM